MLESNIFFTTTHVQPLPDSIVMRELLRFLLQQTQLRLRKVLHRTTSGLDAARQMHHLVRVRVGVRVRVSVRVDVIHRGTKDPTPLSSKHVSNPSHRMNIRTDAYLGNWSRNQTALALFCFHCPRLSRSSWVKSRTVRGKEVVSTVTPPCRSTCIHVMVQFQCSDKAKNATRGKTINRAEACNL